MQLIGTLALKEAREVLQRSQALWLGCNQKQAKGIFEGVARLQRSQALWLGCNKTLPAVYRLRLSLQRSQALWLGCNLGSGALCPCP